MSGVNKCILLGNIGADPIVKHLESGVTVANFPLAVTEFFKDKNTGEKKEQTEWFQILAWRSIADSVERSELKKGDRIYCDGKIKNKKWVDKEGNNRQMTEIVIDNFTIINRKKEKVESEEDSVELK